MLPPEPSPPLPDVDDRLVAPESRYEIENGRVVYVPPADEPHGSLHAHLAAVICAHRAEGYAVAVDMMTRTSRIDDIAPDLSVYPEARDPQTGGRRLEELAFEIASTESLGHAGSKAAKLIARGVRRVFAIDVERGRALEWSSERGTWSMLDTRGQLEDRALAVAIPVEALLDAARADRAILRAYRLQRHPEFLEERRETLVESIFDVLAARRLTPTGDEREEIVAERDLERLCRWLRAAATCATVAALLEA